MKVYFAVLYVIECQYKHHIHPGDLCDPDICPVTTGQCVYTYSRYLKSVGPVCLVFGTLHI